MAKKLVRVSLSIEESLYKKMEKLVRANRYSNRSEFIRDLVREKLVTEEWKAGKEVLGTISLLYDHHKRALNQKLMELEHQHCENIMASTHKHLTKDICAEMVMVKGSPEIIKTLYNELRKQSGVLHSGIIMSSTGEKLD